jgi:hypothetical protein
MIASWTARLHSKDEIARSIADALKIKFAFGFPRTKQPGNSVYDVIYGELSRM